MSRSSSFSAVCRAAGLAALALSILGAPVVGQGPPGAPGGGPNQAPLPLEGARKASFTATEGTWISLDLSPDGRTIVFDLLGDLYLMPVEGGKAQRLTSGMAFDAQPRWSPDGESIVFVSDRSGGDNVWTIRADRADTVQITRGNGSLFVSPEWTPDGEYIVVSRSGGLGGAAKLEMYHREQRSPLPVIRGQNPLKTIGAAFGSDGRQIWYATRTGDWQYDAL
ncbi:MAG: DPP IV N-terminal domain-containing protein, partial [Gemmatimonadota bacterium]|nr:DPP IV N-terminal domain-containing protein [Gemmatimonadota bacterium]